MGGGRHWTNKEEKQLIECNECGGSFHYLAVELGRTEDALLHKLKDLGIRRTFRYSGYAYPVKGLLSAPLYREVQAARAEWKTSKLFKPEGI